MIFQKGVFHKEMSNIQIIPLVKLIQQRQLLPILSILKLLYQLTIIMNTICLEGKTLESLFMEDLYVNDNSGQDKLDIYIKEDLIKENKQKNNNHLLNLLKDILIKFGLNPYDVYKFKSLQEIQIYILYKLEINLNKSDWRDQILQIIYGLEITQSKCYNQNTTYIYHVKVPYYIQSNQNDIIIKWIHQHNQQFRLSEVDSYKQLKKVDQNNNQNMKYLYTYNLEIENSTLMYLQKYSLNLKEYSQRAQNFIETQHRIKICSKLAHELKNLHDKNIIHRDIKPENIMVTAKEMYTDKLYEITDQDLNNIDHLQFSIIDFETTISKGEITNIFLGTQLYAPPENMEGKSYQESYDIWQLGVCFLCFLTQGNLNYPKKQHQKRENQLQELLNQLNNKQNTQNQILHNIIQKMISFDPNNRPKLNDVILELNTAMTS